MAELDKAYETYTETAAPFDLEFDAIPIYGKDNVPKTYLGLVTLKVLNNKTAPSSYEYRVFTGDRLPVNSGFFQQTASSVTQGTLTNTNNHTFVFPINDDFSIDYFVQVKLQTATEKIPSQPYMLVGQPVTLKETEKPQASEYFRIFYTKKVLKERKQKIASQKRKKDEPSIFGLRDTIKKFKILQEDEKERKQELKNLWEQTDNARIMVNQLPPMKFKTNEELKKMWENADWNDRAPIGMPYDEPTNDIKKVWDKFNWVDTPMFADPNIGTLKKNTSKQNLMH